MSFFFFEYAETEEPKYGNETVIEKIYGDKEKKERIYG